MTTCHICQSCRRSILAHLRTNSIRLWPSKRAFVSFRNIPTIARQVPEDLRNGSSFQKVSGDRNRPPQSRMSRANHLESLFEEARSGPSARTSSQPILGSGDAQVWEAIGTLKELVYSKTEAVETAWKFLCLNLGPDVWTRDGKLITPPANLRIVVGQLRLDLRIARQQSQDIGSLPTVAEILTMYASLGMHTQVQWNYLVFDLLRELSQHIQAASRVQVANTNGGQDTETLHRISSLAFDLLASWKFLGNYERCESSHRIEDLDWSFLPQTLPNDMAKSTSRKDWLEEFFISIFPSLPKESAKIIVSAALTTFALLSDPSLATIQSEMVQDPFIKFLGSLLQCIRTGMPVRDMKGLIQHQVTANAIRDIEINWLSVLRQVDRIDNSTAMLAHRQSQPLLNLDDLRRDVGRALAKKDITTLNSLWKDAKLCLEQSLPRDPKLASSPSANISAPFKINWLPRELYDQFLLSYLGLKQPNQAIEVWNHMIRDFRPTLSTWSSMLQGCKIARSPRSLESVWNQLIASGTRPDTVCWTARISGLFECGMIESGMRALYEMGGIWSKAAMQQNLSPHKTAGDPSIIAKPTTATINAAISGLFKYRASDKAHEVLSWGAALGIQPNIITFNILLQASVRSGHIEETFALIQQMQEQGINADPISFTNLIDLILDRKARALTPVDQVDLVNDVFNAMEIAKLQTDSHIYSKIIFSLLKSSPNNMTAVNTVLDRMMNHGLQLSPHICTMIMTRHFGCSPPDLPAVHLLLDRIRFSGIVNKMDHKFWDRVIEGFATVKDTASAMQVLEQLNKHVELSWGTLNRLVKVLVDNAEWEHARGLVRRIKEQKGIEPWPKEIERGQHQFWETIRSARLGLYDSSNSQ